MQNIQVCNRCVMDNRSDDSIVFDEKGNCNYCNKALLNMPYVYFPDEVGERKLASLVERLKKENKNKQYDCLMGISGGLDSSYLAYLGAMKWGLRILAVHIDDGYDTDVTKNNLQKLCDATNIEFLIIKPDKKQFNELTRAFVLAGVPNLAMPQDNVLFACLYNCAKEHGIKTFLSGGNFALECILQKSNTHDAYDLRNIKDINRRFGRGDIDKLPLISVLKKAIVSHILHIESPRPLNYIEYNRERALQELHDFCGFEYYGSKHLENILTRFVQLYWFPTKFNVDKRKSHLSSMIISGQMTRARALEILEEPLYNKNDMEKDIEFILTQLDLSRYEFDQIIAQPPKQHTDYRTTKYVEIIRQVIRASKNLSRYRNRKSD